MIKVKRWMAIGILTAFLIAIATHLVMKSIMYNPQDETDRFQDEIQCTTYLSELLGQGTIVTVSNSIKNRGFGRYRQTIVLQKKGVKRIEISGDLSYVGPYKEPLQHYDESAFLDFFGDEINVFIKSPLRQKWNGIKIDYPQYGLVDTIRLNKDFSSNKSSQEIIDSITSRPDLPRTVGLFRLTQITPLEDFLLYAEKTWSLSSLIIRSYAIKTGELYESPVVFLSTPLNVTLQQFTAHMNSMLKFLVSHPIETKKILHSGLFGETTEIDFEAIQDYISQNGLQAIGYLAEDFQGNPQSEIISAREKNGISKLIEFNLNLPV